MRLRFLPAAVTPVSLFDVAEALVRSVVVGGTPLQTALEKYLSAQQVSTYTSLMRASWACFDKVKTAQRNVIIMPRYLCPSFIHGALAAGCEIRYCDMDPKMLTYDMKQLRRLSLKNVCAVLVPNLFGFSNPMLELRDFCDQHGLVLVEGADYTLGGEYAGKKFGTFGEYTILNFQEGKALPIGGAAVVVRGNGRKFADEKSRTAAFPNIVTMTAYAVFSRPFFYNLLLTGLQILRIDRRRLSMEDTLHETTQESDFKLQDRELKRISGFQSWLGWRIFQRLESTRQARIRRVKVLQEVFSLSHDSRITKLHCLRYPILVPALSRPEIIQRFLAAGIEASPMYVEHGMRINAKEFPGAAKVAESLLTLPCHPFVQLPDIIRMKNLLWK